MAKDVVCGMDIAEVDAAGKVRHGRDMFYFCSPFCCAAFLEDPDKYLSDDYQFRNSDNLIGNSSKPVEPSR